MLITLSKNWTHVAYPIFYDHNHYVQYTGVKIVASFMVFKSKCSVKKKN